VIPTPKRVEVASGCKRVVRKATQEKPAKGTYWSSRSLAKVMGLSASTIRRIWKRHGLKPHLIGCHKAGTSGEHFFLGAHSLSTLRSEGLPPRHARLASNGWPTLVG
jgi:hypothetical protein